MAFTEQINIFAQPASSNTSHATKLSHVKNSPSSSATVILLGVTTISKETTTYGPKIEESHKPLLITTL